MGERGKIMEYKQHNTFEKDLSFGVEAETYFAKLVADKSIEVKRDRLTAKTGNIYIEYEYKGRPSGLATTHADYYLFSFINLAPHFLVKTDWLKKTLKKLISEGKAKAGVSGGDYNNSKGILVKLEILIKEFDNNL